jgi:hypothetical protein
MDKREVILRIVETRRRFHLKSRRWKLEKSVNFLPER